MLNKSRINNIMIYEKFKIKILSNGFYVVSLLLKCSTRIHIRRRNNRFTRALCEKSILFLFLSLPYAQCTFLEQSRVILFRNKKEMSDYDFLVFFELGAPLGANFFWNKTFSNLLSLLSAYSFIAWLLKNENKKL